MYESFFDLKERPFVAAPQPECYFPAQSIEAARLALTSCIERGAGPGLVVGAAGTGKTLLCHKLANQFRDSVAVAMLSSTHVCSRRALLQLILFELGLAYRGMDEGELRLSILDHVRAGDRFARGMLLLADEAHRLPLKLLEEIRMLGNFVCDGQPRVHVVLTGDATLEERFVSPRLEAFNQRLAARCYLSPLNREETIGYVQSQIDLAGGNALDLFTDEAIHAVYQATGGVPRLINQVCEHAMILAATEGQSLIGAAGIEEAWADLQQLPTPSLSGVMTSSSASTSVVEFGSLDDELLDCGRTDRDPKTADAGCVDEDLETADVGSQFSATSQMDQSLQSTESHPPCGTVDDGYVDESSEIVAVGSQSPPTDQVDQSLALSDGAADEDLETADAEGQRPPTGQMDQSLDPTPSGLAREPADDGQVDVEKVDVGSQLSFTGHMDHSLDGAPSNPAHRTTDNSHFDEDLETADVGSQFSSIEPVDQSLGQTTSNLASNAEDQGEFDETPETADPESQLFDIEQKVAQIHEEMSGAEASDAIGDEDGEANHPDSPNCGPDEQLPLAYDPFNEPFDEEEIVPDRLLLTESVRRDDDSVLCKCSFVDVADVLMPQPKTPEFRPGTSEETGDNQRPLGATVEQDQLPHDEVVDPTMHPEQPVDSRDTPQPSDQDRVQPELAGAERKRGGSGEYSEEVWQEEQYIPAEPIAMESPPGREDQVAAGAVRPECQFETAPGVLCETVSAVLPIHDDLCLCGEASPDLEDRDPLPSEPSTQTADLLEESAEVSPIAGEDPLDSAATVARDRSQAVRPGKYRGLFAGLRRR